MYGWFLLFIIIIIIIIFFFFKKKKEIMLISFVLFILENTYFYIQATEAICNSLFNPSIGTISCVRYGRILSRADSIIIVGGSDGLALCSYTVYHPCCFFDFIYSFIHSFIYLFIHLFIYLFIHSFIYLFIYLLLLLFIIIII